jgi:uncharacterized protein (TIGR02646 family)
VRQLSRPALELEARLALYTESRAVAAGADARDEWKRFRGLVACRPILAALKEMSGLTERCAYCSDSLGADVDHYVPLSRDPSVAFAWANMFWVCNNCNRRKADALSYDPVTGFPMLLRPDQDFVWDFLYLDTETGVLTERYDVETGGVNKRAEETLRVFKVLTFEPVIESRRATYRQLAHLCESYLEARTERHKTGLVRAFKEDFHGVSSWVTRSDGQSERIWRELKARDDRLWRRLASIAND